MGAFSTRPDIVIKDQPGWEDGEYITIKGVVEAGDMEAITTPTVTDASGRQQLRSRLSVVAALQCMIVDWMLKGDNNAVVPLYEGSGRNKRKRTEIIAKLPQEYMAPVMFAIGKLVRESQVEDQEDFLPGVNGHSEAISSLER